MTVRYPPPPTKYQPRAAAQGKAASAVPAGGTAPPSTRFGPTRYGPPPHRPTASPPAKAGPAAPARGGPAAQSKTAGGPIRLAARQPPLPPHAIQMARLKEDQEHDFLLLPSPELYQQHVVSRIRHCVLMMKKLAIYCVWAAGQGTTKRISDMVSSKAEVQVGTGLRNPAYKIDAAHLTNISFRPGAMSSGLTLSTDQQQAVAELQIESGATTPQLQKDNVGPDKVIDSVMTDFRAYVQANCTTVVPIAQQILDTLADRCILALSNSAKAGEPNYKLAIAGATVAKTQTTWEIDEDCAAWQKKYGFV
jgi:hypothetical protein